MQAHAAREFLFVFSCQSSKETATAAVLLFGYHAFCFTHYRYDARDSPYFRL